ncbi:MAG: Flp pilus assembly protein CpaB [Caulobacteraceae bacterium]|nr:Flp pilus assembly protein CpaB [Caulobacteraceae bacterium]
MKPVRIIVLAVAALAAVGLALLVRGMVAGKPTSQANAAAPIAQPVARPMARVLVAKRDLKIGDRLTANDLDWQEWPVEAVNAAYVTDGSPTPATPAPAAPTKDGKPTAAATAAAAHAARAVEDLSGAGPKANFVGAVVREPFLAGEPIVERKLVHAGESGYLAVVLQPGKRAMSVAVTVETGAGGFILPGDRVDVILAAQVNSDRETEGTPSKAYTSATVLRNIKVLAIDQATKPENGANTVVGATATLEVGPREAEALALAKSLGDLSLTLRSYADAQQPSGLGDDVLSTQRAAAVGGAAGGVRVFRNGQASGAGN